MTREEAINAFKEWIERDKKMEYADRLENIEIYKLAIKALEQQPKIGRWMECGGYEPWLKGYCCSLCNFTTTQKYDYCTCGAKMIDP